MIVKERFKSALVRLTIFLDRETYEKAESLAKLEGFGDNVSCYLLHLLESKIELAESKGINLTPNWLKEAD